MVQNYYWDAAGRLRWRDDEGDSGLPPSAARIVSPYDLAARYARRGQVTRWTGYLAHVTETCAADGPNVKGPRLIHPLGGGVLTRWMVEFQRR